MDLDNLAGNLTVGRLHFACLAAENDRAAQLGLVQRNAGCLDDDNTGTLGRCRAGFGDVIRNHVIEQFDDLCAGDIRLRANIFAVTLHNARLRYTQDRVGVVRRTQISEVVLRLSLVVHYAVYYNRHICSCYRAVRLKIAVVALNDTAVAPAVDLVFRPVSAGVRK